MSENFVTSYMQNFYFITTMTTTNNNNELRIVIPYA